jgi:hypothetical protein
MLDAPLGSVHVLNVGTTSSLPHHKSRLDRAGLLPWARRAPELILTASSDGTQGTAEHLVGPHHFHRIDAQAPPGVFRLDHSDSRELRGAAAAASRNLGPVFDKHFGAHSASPYQPYQPATQSLETTS